MEDKLRAVGVSIWNWWQRALFRFAFLFLAKFCVTWGILSQITWIAPWFDKWVLRWPNAALYWPTEMLSNWFAGKVFHVTFTSPTTFSGGSGDTRADWVGALSLLVFSLVGAFIWSAVSEIRGRRKEYRILYAWLRLAVRFFLASILLSYGFAKIFDLQFRPPGAAILNQRVGDSSPAGLLWLFMGYSVPYTIFGGIAEVIPGLLLLFRRTATIGALSAATVLLNVVMLNFCYDVSVKLYSSTYLVMAIFLLLPDAMPIWHFFLMDRAARLRPIVIARPERKVLRVASYCLQALVIGHLLLFQFKSSYVEWRKKAHDTADSLGLIGVNAEYANLDGVWVVDSSSGWPRGKEWATVTIGKLRYQSIDFLQTTRADGKQQNFGVSMDWEHRIHFLDPRDSELRWTLDAKGFATLNGMWMGVPASLTMHREVGTPETYPLMKSKFRWVQDLEGK